MALRKPTYDDEIIDYDEIQTEELNAKADSKVDEGNVTLINNWTEVGGSFDRLKIRKFNGFVFISGLITGGTSNVIGTIPAIYRPTSNTNFPVAYSGGVTVISITSGGTLGMVQSSVSRVNVFLSGIVYYVGK